MVVGKIKGVRYNYKLSPLVIITTPADDKAIKGVAVMAKNKSLWFIASIFVVLFSAAAFANYDPHTGRFLTRDPIGYQDGGNLYEYATSRPIYVMDPMGTKIQIPCVAKEKFEKDWLKPLDISSYLTNVSNNDIIYYIPNTLNSYKFKQGILNHAAEITGRMMISERMFKVKGRTTEEIFRNIQLHVGSRINIVIFALSAQMQIGVYDLNPNYWSPDRAVKSNVKSYDALMDIWSSNYDYKMGCLMGANAVMSAGISQALKQFNEDPEQVGRNPLVTNPLLHNDTPVANWDWIPGDWGYIYNPDYLWNKQHPNNRRPLRGEGNRNTNFLQGENIIHITGDKFWGLGGGVKTYDEWLLKVARWAIPSWDDAKINQEGDSLCGNWRSRPKLGLEN